MANSPFPSIIKARSLVKGGKMMQEKREETTSTTKKERRVLKAYTKPYGAGTFAGLVFTPFLLILAVTGGVYLFKPQIEERLYHDLYHVQAQSQSTSPSVQVQAVKEKYPGADVLTYKPSERSTRSSEVGVSLKDHTYTIFVNPHNGHIVGKLDDSSRLMNQIEEFHGELMAGTAGDRIVELAACWAIVLIVTGAFYGGRAKRQNKGMLIPRFSKVKTCLYETFMRYRPFGFQLVCFSRTNGPSVVRTVGQCVSANRHKCRRGVPSVYLGRQCPYFNRTNKDVADVPWELKC
ncbi:PepSY domain-containing protein [Priestia megaterium]